MKYRKGFKYQLAADVVFDLGAIPDEEVDKLYFSLDMNGILTAKKGYAWNGANVYPDTRAILRGSCGHDAGLQIIGMNLLDKSHKKTVDELLRKTYYEDLLKVAESRGKIGRWLLRKTARMLSKTVFTAVRWGGNPEGMEPQPVLEAP